MNVIYNVLIVKKRALSKVFKNEKSPRYKLLGR
nr:MAG TPA: hypothetical protein [Caudoviricetes sp.]